MNIGEILLGLLVGGSLGGGVTYFLQKGRISEIAQRSEQKYLQTRQALEDAEAELEPTKAQLLNSQNQALAYKAQILELQQAATPPVQFEPVDQTQIEEIEQRHQAYIEKLQQTLANQLQEKESAYQAELAEQQQAYFLQLQEKESAYQAELTEQQQAYFLQFQEIEQAYQNQIIELEKTHQIQIQELEQAYQSQLLELQQVEELYEQPVSLSSESDDEMRQLTQFTEPWDEDFSKNTIVDMPFAEVQDENIAKLSSLEELADLTSQTFEAPEAKNAREQADFFATQTLIGELDYSETADQVFTTEDQEQQSELEPDYFTAEDELAYDETLIDEMSFLESLQLDDPNNDYEFEPSIVTAEGSQPFGYGVAAPSASGSSARAGTAKNPTASPQAPPMFGGERLTENELVKPEPNLESNSSLDDEEQSIDLEIFDLFETSDEDLSIDSESKLETNGTHKSNNAYSLDSEVDFFKMLDKEQPDSESLELEDKINIEELFSEDLFHSERESSSKN